MPVTAALPVTARAQNVAFVGVSVLTMDDGPRARANQTVLVRGDMIVNMGARDSLGVDAGFTVIDGRGRTLLPGLMDMHVHLEVEPERWMGVFLQNGITTVLNLRGGPSHLELRQRIARGEFMAPRVYTSGPYVNRPEIESEQDAENAVRSQKAAGYDVLKIHGALGDAAYRRVIETARASNMAVVGHAPRNLHFDSVIALRQAMVAHAEELVYTQFTSLDTTQLREVGPRMRDAGVWLTPTLAVFRGIVAQWGRPAAADSASRLPEARSFPDPLVTYWTRANPYTGRTEGSERMQRMFTFEQVLVRVLHAAGVRMLAGTDTPVPVMFPGSSLHLELAELQKAGLTPYDALLTATRNAGDFIREQIDPDQRLGRVANGYRADLLLVDGDPLRDPTVLRQPAGVMTRGRWLEGAALQRLTSPAR